MRDLTNYGVPAAHRDLPKGLSFEIADLVLIQDWAAFHDLHMRIRLDHGTQAEEYEEVIALHIGRSPIYRALIWRNAKTVFVQPQVGRGQRYASVSAALEGLIAPQPVAVSNITPTAWPLH